MKHKIGKLWKRNKIMITALAIMIAIAGYLNFTGKQFNSENDYQITAKFQENDIESLDDDEMNMTENTSELDETMEVSELDASQTETNSASFDDENASNVASEIPELSDDVTVTDEMAQADMTESDIEAMAQQELAQGAKEGENPGEAIFTSGSSIVSLQEANLTREQMRSQNKKELLTIINNAELSDEVKADAITSMIALTKIASMECDTQILLEAKGFEDCVVSIGTDSVDVMVGGAELSDAQRAQIEDIVKRKTGMTGDKIIISPVGKQ